MILHSLSLPHSLSLTHSQVFFFSPFLFLTNTSSFASPPLRTLTHKLSPPVPTPAAASAPRSAPASWLPPPAAATPSDLQGETESQGGGEGCDRWGERGRGGSLQCQRFISHFFLRLHLSSWQEIYEGCKINLQSIAI